MAKETLEIISSFDSISINDYLEIYEVISNAELNPVEKDLTILGMLTGKPKDFFNQIPLGQTKELFKKIEWVFQAPAAKVQDEYTLMNGRKVKFIKEFKDLTTGQMIDIFQFKKQEGKTDIDHYKNLGNILTCVCLPYKKTKKGKDKLENYLETPQDVLANEFMEHMSIQDACGISLFFLTTGGIFSVIGQLYFQGMTREQLKLILQTLKQEKNIPKKKILELEKKITVVFGNDGIGTI